MDADPYLPADKEGSPPDMILGSVDSPHLNIPSAAVPYVERVSIHDRFILYLVFKPPTGNRQPLGIGRWDFTAQVKRVPPRTGVLTFISGAYSVSQQGKETKQDPPSLPPNSSVHWIVIGPPGCDAEVNRDAFESLNQPQ